MKVLLISQGREFKPRDNRRATFLPPDTSVFPRFGGIQVRNGKREGQRPFFFLPSVLFPLRHHIVLQASNLHPTRFVCIIFPKYVSPYPHRGTLLVYKNFSLSLSLSRVLVNAIKESCFASCSLYLATRPAETCPMRLWCNRGNRMSEEFRRRINPPTNQTRAERLIARGARTAA